MDGGIIMDCKKCGKPIYGHNAIGICKVCIRRMNDDEIMRVLREYLKDFDNDQALVEQVIRDTGITYAKIMKLVEEDRLILKDNEMLLEICMRNRKRSVKEIGDQMRKIMAEEEEKRKEKINYRVGSKYLGSKFVEDIEKKKENEEVEGNNGKGQNKNKNKNKNKK